MRPNLPALLSMLGALALCGCSQKPSPTSPVIPQGKPQAVKNLSTTGHVATGDKADHNIAREDVDILLQLDIYHLTVPSGAISASDRFWKHIDEDHVDLATHALLLKNGVRYGIGANDEWDYFKGLIDHYGATAKKGSTAPVKRGGLELPLRTAVDRQIIFYFNHDDEIPHGRSYEKCDDLLALSFEPTPRRPGDSRLAISALVRSLRQEYHVTLLNEVREIELIKPEYYYDLRLMQDVPLDHFLVIGPTKPINLPDNLGHQFFITPGGAEPMETVLLIVPRPYRVSGETPNVPMNRVMPDGK
ncbi:MAG TPA: hypothetical protein VFE47_16235 [Tepidisphaeraceae bacterium]|nr:hypothetical protein [Tepidisphaeraceae bacterium]